MGKVTVINSLATSAIWYLSNLIQLPNEYAKQIETMIIKFRGGGGMEVFSRNFFRQISKSKY